MSERYIKVEDSVRGEFGLCEPDIDPKRFYKSLKEAMRKEGPQYGAVFAVLSKEQIQSLADGDSMIVDLDEYIVYVCSEETLERESRDG